MLPSESNVSNDVGVILWYSVVLLERFSFGFRRYPTMVGSEIGEKTI